jgi:hypothetical protein
VFENYSLGGDDEAKRTYSGQPWFLVKSTEKVGESENVLAMRWYLWPLLQGCGRHRKTHHHVVYLIWFLVLRRMCYTFKSYGVDACVFEGRETRT